MLILFDEGKALKTPKKEKMKMTTTMKRTISLRYVPSHLINANPKLPKVRSKRKQRNISSRRKEEKPDMVFYSGNKVFNGQDQRNT